MAGFKLYHNLSGDPEYIANRFWSKVDKSGDCWTWNGSKQGPGYGLFKLKNRLHKAHRVALMLSGIEVPDHLCVLHSCDNPPCCNPAHLRLGTKGENNTERHAKGRTVLPVRCRGENSLNAKLTENQVREMRRMKAGGMSYAEVARSTNVGPRHVWDIINRRCWAHI